jgi:hypothetical protein
MLNKHKPVSGTQKILHIQCDKELGVVRDLSGTKSKVGVSEPIFFRLCICFFFRSFTRVFLAWHSAIVKNVNYYNAVVPPILLVLILKFNSPAKVLLFGKHGQ